MWIWWDYQLIILCFEHSSHLIAVEKFDPAPSLNFATYCNVFDKVFDVKRAKKIRFVRGCARGSQIVGFSIPHVSIPVILLAFRLSWGIAQDALVMNLDDLLCVGITDNILLSSTIGRNKNLIPREVIGAVIAGTAALVDELNRHGVGIILTGGETADVGDLVRTIIVDSTVAAQVPRSDVIDNVNIRAGDVIVALSSSGRATYEESYNSGIGSNGLTAARHDTFKHSLAAEFPESFDPMMAEELVYSGKVGLEDPIAVEGFGTIPAGKLLLSPTRTYGPIVQKIFAAGLRQQIHGMVHCSGGAQTKVLHFVDGVHVIKDNLMKTAPVFRLIQENSGTPWEEMYKVFNMGHRLEFYTNQEAASKIMDISNTFGVDAQIIGRVEALPAGKKKVTIKSEHGLFEYGS